MNKSIESTHVWRNDKRRYGLTKTPVDGQRSYQSDEAQVSQDTVVRRHKHKLILQLHNLNPGTASSSFLSTRHGGRIGYSNFSGTAQDSDIRTPHTLSKYKSLSCYSQY